MKNIYYTLCLLCWLSQISQAQINFTVYANGVSKYISPYIYGVNSNGSVAATIIPPGLTSDSVCRLNETEANISARRLGGDRMTPYNWENNISTQGSYGTASDNENDDYLPYLFGVNSCTGTNHNSPCIPNLINKRFLEGSLMTNAYSLLTLPMIGYVANNITAPNPAATAPSVNFNQIVFNKPGAPATWLLSPSLVDGKVYVDEELNELINYCDNIKHIAHPNGYCLDNEVTIWESTHPHIHPAIPTCNELITKSVTLANVIKNQDPKADVFGASHINFAAYWDGNAYNRANGWNLYHNVAPDYYQTYNEAYLGEMKKASAFAGKRLLDFVDVHWYPYIVSNNVPNGIDNADVSAYTRIMRMQAPRSFDDSLFIENSWLAASPSGGILGNAPVVYLKRLQSEIDKRYSGTKLSISEYRFGAEDDISGGIAVVDALGRFAKHGVAHAYIFNEVTGYVASALKLYRNYDGNNSTFGDYFLNTSSDEIPTTASIVNDGMNNYKFTEMYAAANSKDPNELHLIVVNKNITPYTSNITINSSINYSKYSVYQFDAGNNAIVHSIVNNQVNNNTITNFNLPALTAMHIVLTRIPAGITHAGTNNNQVIITPNPSIGNYNLSVTDKGLIGTKATLTNIKGEIVKTFFIVETTTKFDITEYPAGIYMLKFSDGTVAKIIKI